MAERGGQSTGLVDPSRVLRQGKPASLGQAGHPAPQEADGLRFGEWRDLDAVRDNVTRPVRLARGNDDMALRPTARYVLLQVKWIGGIVEYEQPTRPFSRSQRFENGGYRPVACAVRGCLPE